MERKLTAILSADVKGYSRLMGDDEEATIRTLTAYREVMTSLIQQHRGRVVDSPGDNLLAEFASAVDAVQGAVEIQRELKAKNVDLPDSRKMEYRIGLNVGDVIVEGERLYGDGVNIAARLEGLAEPGGICISGTVYDQVKNKVALGYEYLGEQEVKNIAEPVRVWRVTVEEEETQQAKGKTQKPVLSIVEGAKVESKERSTSHKGAVVALASLLLVAGTLATVWFLFFPTPSPQPPTPSTQALSLPDKPSIAVLPFTNMSGDPGQEHISDGMTEAIITDLSKLSGLFVIARNSVFTYKGRAVKVNEVGRELGVRYVLEGSVQKADSRVRITAQLIDATTGGHLWAKNYDREWKDIFALQDDITQQIGAELRGEVKEAELARVRRIPTDNLTAYEAVLRGEAYFFRFTKEANVQARQLFARAIELDPEYAAAYVDLGWTYAQESAWWGPAPQELERVFGLAQRAVLLDDSLSEVHSLLALVYLAKGQPDLALAEAERAITLAPNNADAYVLMVETLAQVGRAAEGVILIEKAMRLNPYYPTWYLFDLGLVYRLTGQYEQAIATHRQSLIRHPDYLPLHCNLVESYLMQWVLLQTQDPQTLERALESAQKAVALNDAHPWAHSVLSRVYLWRKQHAQAIAEAERTIALDPSNADHYATLSSILSYAGQPEKALKMVEQALRLNPHPPGWYFQHLGQAYRLTGRMEEAIAAQQKALALAPDKGGIHIELAVLYSEAGREAEARAEVAELQRIFPRVSLEILTQGLPYKDPAVVERMLAALRKAGLK